MTIFMNMEDLLEITKDYFKKNEQEKQEILEEVFGQFAILIIENQFSSHDITVRVNRLIEKAELREDYEVAELFKQILNKVINELYNV